MTKIAYRNAGLIGRLGNALFEIAATIGVALSYDGLPQINANWTHRPYFSVPDEFFTDDFGGCVNLVDTPDLRHLDERCRVYAQDYSLFAEHIDSIREWFRPSELASGIIAEHSEIFDKLATPVLSVHVRRGDNVVDPGVRDKHNYFPVPTLDFYRTMIEQLRSRAGSIAVFSDDPAWCEENLDADYYHHGLARPKEHEPDFLTAPFLDFVDLQLMTRCTGGHVLSNSSFGVWGAILAGDLRAVVPWPFFGPKLDYIRAEIQMPDTWLRYDYRHKEWMPPC